MTFKNLLERLSNKETFEQIENGKFDVKCCGNAVYENDDFYNYITTLGVEDIDFGCGYAMLYTNNGIIYEIPYECNENGVTILYFDYERIYDVTNDYYYDYEYECFVEKAR